MKALGVQARVRVGDRAIGLRLRLCGQGASVSFVMLTLIFFLLLAAAALASISLAFCRCDGAAS